MTEFFSLLLVLVVVALFVGLIKPSLVIRWGEPEKRTRGKVLKTYLIALVAVLLLGGVLARNEDSESKEPAAATSTQETASSSSAASSGAKEAKEKKPVKEDKPKWNTSDSEAQTNGNAKIAVKELKKVEDMKAVAEQVAPAELMKRPWDYYGKVVAYSGRISDIGDNPPGSPESKAFGTDTYTIVVMGDNDSSVQAIMAGKSGSLQKDQQVTIYGFPVGNLKLQNRMGGENNAVLLIGK